MHQCTRFICVNSGHHVTQTWWQKWHFKVICMSLDSFRRGKRTGHTPHNVYFSQSGAQALPMLLGLPTFLIGHNQLDLPIHVLGQWACSSCGKPNQLLGQVPARRWRSKSTYLVCTWAFPPSVQPAWGWAQVWQAQDSPSPAHGECSLISELGGGGWGIW